MDFFNNVGTMAIGSRLRMLSERMMEEAREIYDFYGVGLKPKWFPVFYVLSQNEEKPVTVIAEEIGHSHPSVSKIVREMAKEGVVSEKKDKKDKRKNNVMLTKKGRALALQMEEQCFDVRNAVDHLLSNTNHNMWKAIEEFEFLLENKSLVKRVQEKRKERELKKVRVVPFENKYSKVFWELNEAWISNYFRMEEIDKKALQNPQEYILDNGGYIAVALYDNLPVGVCALIKMNDPDYDYELAKMAVDPMAKGKGIGWILGTSIVEKAKALGAKKIYLESNTVLKPAISLYQKLGFNKITNQQTPYERCNIQMELLL